VLAQNRGDVRRLQHGKAGEAMSIGQQHGDLGEFIDQQFGKMRRLVLGFALGKIDQDRGDRRALLGQIDAGDQVGLVFLGCQRRSLGIRGGLRQSVDGKPARIAHEARIGMQRDEDVRVIDPRHLEALAQGHENVAPAGQLHPIAAGGQKLAFQLLSHGQSDILLIAAAMPDGAGIGAAMARIDIDQRKPGWFGPQHRNARRQGHDRHWLAEGV
jgi:hypothetical protein